ncbi:MAG: pyridoxamine 5'-phosphate oxidase family protein [Firmicutes bacterium]|nr:pyridoxamine 5'-phosphate oxidase family protein [Bacillota bacterium]
MRRKDREITDWQAIMQIVGDCHCCRVGFNDGGRVYIVPLNFGYEVSDGGDLTFYFHSAQEGRKMDLLRQSSYAAFEMDTGYSLQVGSLACTCTAAFQSIFGEGETYIITDPEDKIHALQLIMQHNTGRGDWKFVPAMLDEVAIWCLRVKELSCKQHE